MDRTIKVWDIVSRQLLHTIDAQDYVRSVAISSDGKYIVSAGNDKKVRLWNSQDGKLIHTFTGHNDRILSVVISKDG